MALQSSLPHDPRARCPEVPLATLNVIVRQAIAATGASGSAVALSDGHAIVFQASCGDPAPAIGVPLNASARFSGECIRTGEVLRCDDAECDPLVDGALCAQLGIRSMLAVPVKAGVSVVGVLQVFSREPYAFNVFHEATLERLADMILRASGETWIRSAIPTTPAAAQDEEGGYSHRSEGRSQATAFLAPSNGNGGWQSEPTRAKVTIELPNSYVANVGFERKSRRPRSSHRKRHWRTRLRKAEAAIQEKPVMSAIMVSSLILIVGFLVTLATRNESRPAVPQIAKENSFKSPSASSQQTPPSQPSSAQDDKQSADHEQSSTIAEKPSADVPSSEASGAQPPDVVAVARPEDAAKVSANHQAGKMSGKKLHASSIKQKKSRYVASSAPVTGPAFATVNAIPSANGGSTLVATLGTVTVAPVSTPVPLRPELVPPQLVQQVKPQYPAMARISSVQGAVILEAIISKEGKVRAVKAVSGNALLTAAAINAVRNWRYSPSLLHGEPVEATVRVTVNFTSAN